MKKLETLAEKKDRLMDLFLGREITKEEYRRMSERYDNERELLEEQKKETEKQKELSDNQQQILDEIAVSILALGEQQDDTFYRNIVEKIVVHNRQHIDISLNLLPYKWAYLLSELPGNKPGKVQGPTRSGLADKTEHFDTSLLTSEKGTGSGTSGNNHCTQPVVSAIGGFGERT